jgi:hypothetical protein
VSTTARKRWRTRLSPKLQAHSLIKRRLKLREHEAAQFIGEYQSRHRPASWWPDIASAAAFLGWMVAFGRATDALETTRFDIAAVWRGSWLGVAALLLLSYGVAAALAIAVGFWLQTRLLLRPIRRCIELPACFNCNQSLQGVPTVDGRLTCPECGAPYPAPVASITT